MIIKLRMVIIGYLILAGALLCPFGFTVYEVVSERPQKITANRELAKATANVYFAKQQFSAVDTHLFVDANLNISQRIEQAKNNKASVEQKEFQKLEEKRKVHERTELYLAATISWAGLLPIFVALMIYLRHLRRVTVTVSAIFCIFAALATIAVLLQIVSAKPEMPTSGYIVLIAFASTCAFMWFATRTLMQSQELFAPELS